MKQRLRTLVAERRREALGRSTNGAIKGNYGYAGDRHGGNVSGIHEQRDDHLQHFYFSAKLLQLPFLAVQDLIDIAHEFCDRESFSDSTNPAYSSSQFAVANSGADEAGCASLKVPGPNCTPGLTRLPQRAHTR